MRLEYKYLIPIDKLSKLREYLLPFVNIDEYAQMRSQKEYTVRSIYYDTMRLDDYSDKLAGLKIRKKIRIRCYNELESDSPVFLEVKRKYENHISKNRAPVMFQNLNQILHSSDIDKYLIRKKSYPDERNDAAKFFYLVKMNNCTQVVLVVYEREAFFSKHDSTLRITFDKNIRSSAFPKFSDLFEDNNLKTALQNFFILEVKFYSGFPKWLQNVISHFEIGRQALSKYTMCIDNHDDFRKYLYGNKILIPSLVNSFKTNNERDLLKNVG